MKNQKKVDLQSWPATRRSYTIISDRGKASRYIPGAIEKRFSDVQRLLRKRKFPDTVEYKDLCDHLASVCAEINAIEIFHRQSEEDSKP